MAIPQRQGPAARSCALLLAHAASLLSLTRFLTPHGGGGLLFLRVQASALYETIEAAESIDESGLPDQAYVVPEGTLGGTAPLNPTTRSAASVSPPATTRGKPQSQQIFDATGAH